MQAIVKFPVAIPLAVLLAAIIALVLAAPSVLAQDTEQPPTEAASGGGSGSAGARLAELDFHGVALEPRFHPEQADYQGYMYSREMGSTTVTATAADADATVTISPADADADVAGHQVDLTAGEDVSVEVTVTSSDGTSESVYTVAMKYGDGFAKLSVGRDNACALRKDGTVECWNGASEPAGVHQDVAGGSSGYVCGVRADGTMHCWGGIHYADTGVQAVEMFTHALCWLKTDGSIRCDGSYMPDLEGGAGRGPYQSVTVGYEFVCALTTGNLVKCVKTLDIFLPIPEPETEFKHIDSGGYAVCGIRMDDTLLCWKYITGSKSNYQLVFDRVIAATPVGEFKSVAAGTFFACAVKSADGSITCFKHTDTWGWSDRPRIGKILDNVPEGEFQRVGAGQFFACGLKTDDSIDCWDDRNHVQDPSMVSPRAGEAHLESLELSDPASAGVTLTPRFNGDTPGGYLAEVPAETPLITVTPVATNRFAEVIITPPDADPDTEGHQVALDVGTNSVSVTVTSWDDSAEKTYTLEIIRREQRTYNAAPAFDTLYRSVAENSPAGTPVGPPVVASDPDADPVTYSLRGADAASFRIDAATGQIYTVEGVEYDYETKPTYSVTARADDGYGPSATAQVVISLTDELQEDGSTPEQNTPATGQPTISGTAQVGETLTADTSGIADADGLTNVSYSYQWIASDGAADADISGATDATYTLTFAEAEKTIKVRVSFTDDAGNAESLTSAATDAVAATSQQQANRPATGQPVIGGTAQVGETLTADTSGISDDDGLDNATFAYQWAADGVDISGATGSSYTLVEADEGRTISVTVSFTDDAGNAETLTSAATTAVAAKANTPATGQPVISGTAQVGGTLAVDTSGIADADGLTNATFTYQWQADGADIASATGSAYTLVDADEGKAITVTVSFTDDAGNAETLSSAATEAVAPKPNTPATGQPAISGTAQVGETLSADVSGIADADGLTNPTFAYQWLADDAQIAGATASSYTLTDADEGKAISVTVSFTDDRGHSETLTSAATAAVAGPPSEPLTASLSNGPTSHDGENTFTFELRFSEEFSVSYKRLRDDAFEVTGGAVRRAQRLERGSNAGWRITVSPSSNSDVVIVLPETTDCDDDGAICTGDGRMLSNRSELTVSGP